MPTIEEMNAIFDSIEKKNDKLKICLIPVNELKDQEPFCQNKDADIECSICYKLIHNQKNNVFVCTNPCNKVFHTYCMNRMIEQLDDSAYKTDKDPHYRCCYCRRDFDINYYHLELFMRKLLSLKAGGYYVNDAIKQATEYYLNYDKDNVSEPLFLNIEMIVSISHIKKPKQSKNDMFKLTKNRQHNKRHYHK